jgi:hypothetical protein
MTAKSKSKPKAKTPAPKLSVNKEATVLDARGHKPESRKAKVHALYDKDGPESAFVLGQKLKLKDNTLRSWFMVWRRRAVLGFLKASAGTC